MEINPLQEVKEYIQKIARYISKFISPSSYEMLNMYYDGVSSSTEAQESALFDKLICTICENKDNKQLHIIVDTAPTGHTIRLFGIASLLLTSNKTLLITKERSEILDSIIGNMNDKDDISIKLEERYITYTRFNNILKNRDECGITFVLNPDEFSLSKTQLAINQLKKSVEILGSIINKILPQSQDEFFKSRYADSHKNLQQITEKLGYYQMLKMPLFSSDITKLEDLKTFAHKIGEQFL